MSRQWCLKDKRAVKSGTMHRAKNQTMTKVGSEQGYRPGDLRLNRTAAGSKERILESGYEKY